MRDITKLVFVFYLTATTVYCCHTHLYGLAIHGPHHVPRLDGTARGHVLTERHQGHHAAPVPQLRQSKEGGDNTGSPAHVPTHQPHPRGGLDGDTTSVKGHTYKAAVLLLAILKRMCKKIALFSLPTRNKWHEC